VDGYGVVALTPLRTVDAGVLLRGGAGGLHCRDQCLDLSSGRVSDK